MNLDFAESSSVVHIRQGLKDIVGQWTRSNDVGAKHSGDNIGIQPRFFYPNASPFPRDLFDVRIVVTSVSIWKQRLRITR